jgi:HEAT repeat protein
VKINRPALRPARLLPKTIGGRVFLAGGICFILLFTIAAIIAGSIWVEDRFPSDDADRALLPRAQKITTRPIVNAISRQIERYVRRKVDGLYMTTGLTLEETIARFFDERVDLTERRVYAYRLARMGTPESIAALMEVLKSAPPEHQAFMAQLIGSTGSPAGKECLVPLLDSTNEDVVAAAIRGLSAIGGDDAVERVAKFLVNEECDERIRIEAARGLGVIGSSAAHDQLTRALERLPSTDLATQILNSLGGFEFPVISQTFEQYLGAPETPGDMRVVAVEALANSTPDTVPFLVTVAGDDDDADVRASAAWAIGAHDSVKHLGPTLADLAEQEPAADVRRRLYESMLPQASIPADRLLPLVMQETDLAARIAGFNAIGRAAFGQPAVATVFDRDIVPELQQIATTPNSLNLQMRAVFALRRAQTPAAQSALSAIASSARPQIATAALNGLRPRKS